MKSIGVGLMAAAWASAGWAQTTTNCMRLGPSLNCNTIGPGGMSMTNCNRLGPQINCNTIGDQDDDDGAAPPAGSVDLSPLFAEAIKAAKERREQDRLKRVAALVAVHDCDGAVQLAQRENDMALAAKIPAVCLTKAQAGEEPNFLVSTAPDPIVIEWARQFIHPPADAQVLSADRAEVQYALASPAPAKAIWVRSEALSPDGVKAIGGRSSLMMVSFDCEGQRFTIMASTVYPGQNLSGQGKSDDTATPPLLIRPGSKAEAWSHKMCQGTPAAAPPSQSAGAG